MNRNFIQKSFDITKQNLILAQPLIIFMIVLSFTLAGLAMQTNKITYIVFTIANVLLFTAFCAGWFYMIRQGIYLNKRIENGEYKKPEEQAAASMALGKEFFVGVGEKFLPVTATMIFYLALTALAAFVCYKLGLKILPNPDIDLAKIKALSDATPVEIQKFVYSLSYEQLKAVSLWVTYLTGSSYLFGFVTMYLMPAIFDTSYEKKEFFLLTPFLAFYRNIVFIFKNLAGSLGILIFLIALHTILSVLSIIFNLNIVFAVIGLILSFYFMTYAMVLIFLYYETRKF